MKPLVINFLQVFSKSDRQKPGHSVSAPLANRLDPILGNDLPGLEELSEESTIAKPRQPLMQLAAHQVRQGTQSTLRGMGQTANQHKVPLLWLTFIALVSGTGIGAFLWLSRVPPAADCQQITVWSVDSERLYCAQQAVQTGKPEAIIQSIQLVKDWPASHPLYTQGQLLLGNWSNALLLMAGERMSQRDLKGAIALARQIPDSSPTYQEAQAAITRWQVEWHRGKRLYDKIQLALKDQNWDQASDNLAKLSLINDPGWQERVANVRLQITAEKKAWQALKDARAFAKANPPQLLGQAIALADPIGRQTWVWKKAEAEVLRWRNTIFDLAAKQLANRKVAEASRLINSVPASITVTSAGQDLIRLVRAGEAELGLDNRSPTLDQVFPLIVALKAVEQITAASPFHAAAQKTATRLEQQIENLLHLQVASSLANLGQGATLRAAVAHANKITLKQPRRLQAQTLMAMWQSQLQRLEDRPTLQQAQHWAKAGSLPQLRSAVSLANHIPARHSLYGEAQTQVAQWTTQIQTIEDRPILAEARALATRGNLEQAIATAGKIRPGRALYGEAQTAAGGWIAELQAIADRGVLNRATALAEQGSLSRAIEVASTIGYGRSLYGEAQRSIAIWADQRAIILRARETAKPEPSPESTPAAEGSSDSGSEPPQSPTEIEPTPPTESPEPQ